MADRKGYRWQCESCPGLLDFRDVVRQGPLGFLWHLSSTDWDQDLLLQKCPTCTERRLRIVYWFPREKEEEVRVTQIVGRRGLDREEDDYLPMLWEVVPRGKPAT